MLHLDLLQVQTGRQTTWSDDNHRHKQLIMAVLSAWYKALVVSWVGISVYVDNERSRHQMWSYLRLLVNHVVVGVANQRSVISVEKHRLGKSLRHKTKHRSTAG